MTLITLWTICCSWAERPLSSGSLIFCSKWMRACGPVELLGSLCCAATSPTISGSHWRPSRVSRLEAEGVLELIAAREIRVVTDFWIDEMQNVVTGVKRLCIGPHDVAGVSGSKCATDIAAAAAGTI